MFDKMKLGVLAAGMLFSATSAQATVVPGSGSADVLFGDLNGAFTLDDGSSVSVLYNLAGAGFADFAVFVPGETEAIASASDIVDGLSFDLGGGATLSVTGFGLADPTLAGLLAGGDASYGNLSVALDTGMTAIIPLPTGCGLLLLGAAALGIAGRRKG